MTLLHAISEVSHTHGAEDLHIDPIVRPAAHVQTGATRRCRFRFGTVTHAAAIAASAAATLQLVAGGGEPAVREPP